MKLRLPHKFQTALMAALASVSITTLSTGAAYAEGTPLTFGADLGDVMYVGDSITHGIDAASWRWSMHKILVDAGVSYDENGYTSGNSTGGVPAGTTYGGVAFENVHSAHSGGDAYEVIGRKQRSGGHYGNSNIYNWLGVDTDKTVRGTGAGTYTGTVTDHVDNFLMLIGTNDLLSTYQDNATAIAGSASNDLVTDINNIYGVMRQANPGSQLVLLSIPCWTDHANNNSAEVHQAVATANEKLKTWAESQSGVLYVDVNEGLVDVSSNTPFWGPRTFFRAPTGDGLHPNAQGELIIAGNVARAMGYAGRSVGLERSSAAEPAGVVWTTPITEQTTITAGAAARTVASDVFTAKDGYTVDFNAVYGNGGEDGTWDNANAFSITVGDGTHSGTLSLTEAYVKWDNKILYSKNNSVAGDNLRIAYVNASAYSEDNVSAGYYVWLGDKLIGEALTAGSASAGFNGVSLQATGANATISTLSWTNYAYAPTTEGYVNEDAAFKLAQTYPMPTHDDPTPASLNIDFSSAATANGRYGTDNQPASGELVLQRTGGTETNAWFSPVGADHSGNVLIKYSNLQAASGSNLISVHGGNVTDGNVAVVLDDGTHLGKGHYGSTGDQSVHGVYGHSLSGALKVEVNNATLDGGILMGVISGNGSISNGTQLLVNKGAVVGGNVYGGGLTGTVNGGTSITITGGSIAGSVYGGGKGGAVNGGSSITISGGVISGNVVGGAEGGTFTGTTSVTVDGNLASIGGNIEADTVTLKNVASNTQGYTDGFDYYQGTIRAPRVELVDFTVERFMANIETQSLVLSGGSNTTLTNLTLTACDIDAQGTSTVTLDGTLSLGETTTYSGSVALADGLTIDMTGGEVQYTGEYSEGTSGYKMGSRDVMKLAEAAAEGSTLDVNTEALVGAGALAGNTFSYDSATGTLTATGADLTTFYVNAGDSLQYSSPVEENPVYGATGIAMNGGSLEFVEALKNGVTLGVTADGSQIIVDDGVDMAVKEITLSTLESHALTLSGTMTASTAAEITANLIGGNANITTTGNISLSNGATSHAGGVLTVGAGLNFSLNSARDHTYNISSFKQIVLESGSAINYHGGTGTFNNVTLAEGDASISITDMAASSMLTLAGETQLNGHRLSITATSSSWKRFVTIAQLVGDADSTLYFEGGKTNDGSGSHLTINSLQGFSGTLELKENNSGNPLIATVGTGSGSAVNLKALNLTGSGEEVTLSGTAPLSIGSLAMSQASSLTAGSLTVGALSGAGSLNITGDLAINGQSGDSTHSGNVKVLGEVTKSGAGSQTLGGGTLAFLDKITVEGGTLNIGTAGSTATYAGTISNSGVLGLNGTIALSSANLSAFTQVEGSATTTTYSGTGDFEGSGYMQSSAEYYLVKGSGTVSGTYDIDETTGSLVTGKSTGGNVVVTFKSSDNTGLYYVNKTLNYDAATMGTASGFVIAPNAALNSDGSSYASAPKVLHGEGTYALANNAKALNPGLSLGTDWTGAVRISGYSFANDMNALNSLANSNSWVELVGVHGWSNSVAINANLILGADSNGWSYYQDNGNNDQVLTINGVVKGTGKFGRSNTTGQNQTHVFTNDISGWTGTYEARSVNDRSTTLRLTNNAHEVNATISMMSGVFNVDVQTDVAFSKAITATTLAVTAGHTATLGANATLGGLTGAGNIAVSTSNVTITLNGTGTYAFDGAITGAHLLNKTGAGTQTINGPVTVDRFTISGGTTTFNGLVTGTATGYTGNDRRMSVSGGTVYFNNGFAYSGGETYALVTSGNSTVHFGGISDLSGKNIGPGVSTAKIVLDANAILKVNEFFNSTTNTGNNGTLDMKSGSELTLAGKMYLTGATSEGGTIHMGNNASVNLHAASYTPAVMEFGLGAVVLDGANATIQTLNYGGTVKLDSIEGTGTLTLKAGANSTVRNTFSIGGSATETKFSGTLALERATGANRVLLAEFNDQYSAAGAVVQASLTGSHNNEAVGILINSNVVQMKGLKDGTNITSANSYALASGSASRLGTTNGNSNQYLDNASDGTSRTLEFTGSAASDSYTTAIKVLSGVNLTMSGAGSQTFNGDLSAMNGAVTVNAGKLTLANSAASAGRLASITVTGGTLQLSKMDVAGASSLSGGALEINGTVAMSGALEQTGGTLSVVSGGDLTLSAGGTLISTVTNAGSLTLGGTINLGGGRKDYALFAEGEDTYSGEDEYEGSGYLVSCTDQYYLVKDNGGTLTVSEGFALTGGQRMTESVDPAKTIGANDFVFQFVNAGPVGGTYYVNKSLTYNADEMGEADALSIKEDATLTVDEPAAIKAITGGGSLANNAALTLGGEADSVFAGTVSGSGDIEKVGSGTQTINGNMVGFSGGITATAGTLDIDVTYSHGSITTHAVTVAEGATLNLKAGGDGGQLFANGTIYNNGTIDLTVETLVLNPDNYSAYELREGESRYTGTGDYTGSGFLNAEAKYYLVKGGENGSVSFLIMDSTGGTPASQWGQGQKDLLMTLDFSHSMHNGVYYVNSSLTYSQDEMGTAETLSIVPEATLTVDAPATIKAIAGGGSLVNNAALTLGGAANAVFTGTVSGSGDIEKVGSGTQTVNGNMVGFSGGINVTAGTLDIDVTQTHGSITTHAVTVAEGATLNLAAGGDGGQLIANGTMHNDGNLSLVALELVLNPDNYTAYEVYAGDKQYTGTGNAEGSGYLNADARYYLVKGGENSTLSSWFMDCTGGTYLAPSTGDKDLLVKLDISEHAGTYYVNDNMNSHDDVKESQYDILRASDIVIEEGVTLTAYTVNDTFTDAKLHGEGTYALANKQSALNTGLSLGDDWAGTVLVTNAVDVTDLGTTIQNLTQGDSWVELRNVNGTLGGNNTYSGNIILTDNGSATAMRITTSTSGTTTHLTGDIKGNGTIERRIGNGNTLYFDGDLSGWFGGYYNGGKDGSFNSGNNTLYFTHGGEINADFVNRARNNNCYLTLNFQADTIVNSDLYTEPGAGQTSVQALNIGVTANATFNGNVTATNLRGSATSSVVVGKDATMTLIATGRNYSLVSDLDNQGVLSIKADGGDIRFHGKSDDQVFNLGNFVIDGDTGTSFLLTADAINYSTDIAVKKLTGGGAGHILQVTTCYTGGGTNEGKVIDFIIGDEESPATAATYTGTIQYGTGSGSVKGGAGMNVVLKDEYVAANAVLETFMSGGTYATVTVDTERAKVKGLKDATTGKTVNVSGTAADKNRVLEIVGGDNYTYNGKLGANLDVVHSGNGTQSFGGVDGFNGSIDVEAGVLNILNAASVAVQDVTIGAGATLGVYNSGTATPGTANEGALTIENTKTLTADGTGATLNANLELATGSTLDVSATGGSGLHLGSTLTINPGMQLSDADMRNVWNLEIGQTYNLIYGEQFEQLFIKDSTGSVTATFNPGELTADKKLDAHTFYNDLQENHYYVVFTNNGGNVGTYAIYCNVPEPTTSTLSLLALCALAARRRRK